MQTRYKDGRRYMDKLTHISVILADMQLWGGETMTDRDRLGRVVFGVLFNDAVNHNLDVQEILTYDEVHESDRELCRLVAEAVAHELRPTPQPPPDTLAQAASEQLQQQMGNSLADGDPGL